MVAKFCRNGMLSSTSYYCGLEENMMMGVVCSFPIDDFEQDSLIVNLDRPVSNSGVIPWFLIDLR
jgi:hypothetical protein